MSTDTVTPAPAVAARPRRRRWLVVVFAAVALVAALPAAAARTKVFAPLVQGAAGGLEGSTITLDDRFGDERRELLLYQDRVVRHGTLTLVNRSRFTVRIEEVGHTFGEPGLPWGGIADFRPDADLLDPPNAYGYDGAPAFAPFTLPPGEDRTVEVGLWLDNCEWSSPGSGVTITEVPVRYRILGMTRTMSVHLDNGGWEIRLDKAADCPRIRPVEPDLATPATSPPSAG